MAITSGFFNSIGGDRKYNAEHLSRFFDKIVGSGVFPNPSTNLQVVAAGGMKVNVLSGRGMIDCRWIDNDATEVLTLEQSDVLLNRIDAVVMVLDLNESVRNGYIKIKKGTPATTPTAPVMERSEKVKEYCLATVYVAALSEEVKQANITDTRANTAVCGWVTSLIDQVDTETLFLQWQDAYEAYYRESTNTFEAWFANVRDTLMTSAAIKRFVSAYVTTQEGETEIPIGISDFRLGVDMLNVYINGLRLIDNDEYTVSLDGTKITLALGVYAGTPIMFEVYKVVDAEDVWSAVRMLEDMEPKIYKNVIVPADAWTQGATYFETVIANDTIDENTFVNVNFHADSLETVMDAGVLSVAESVEGAIKLYSASAPVGDVVCDYTVQKGRVI